MMPTRSQDRQQQVLAAGITMLGLALTIFMVSEVASPCNGEAVLEVRLTNGTSVAVGLNAPLPEEARQTLSMAGGGAGYTRSSTMAMPWPPPMQALAIP